MYKKLALFATLLSTLVLVSLGPPARAADPVDLALVLVSDVSRSIDDREFDLQKKGYRAAFLDPRVLMAIKSGVTGAIAVTYVEFADFVQVQQVVDWAIIRDEETAGVFADQLAKAPRSFWGRTSISAGVDYAMQLLNKSGIKAARRVIDVAGDGTNNAGREVSAARDEAVRAGVTINGLTIINDNPMNYNFAHVQPPGGLAQWYRQNVTGGANSFVLEVHDFHSFGEAMTRKLITEIAGADFVRRQASLSPVRRVRKPA